MEGPWVTTESNAWWVLGRQVEGTVMGLHPHSCVGIQGGSHVGQGAHERHHGVTPENMALMLTLAYCKPLWSLVPGLGVQVSVSFQTKTR